MFTIFRQDFSVGKLPSSVEVADLNNDGNEDILTTNEIDNNVSILLGDGNGDFGDDITFSVGQTPRSIGIGYFDSDNNLDIAVSNNDDDNVSVLLGNGDGTFASQITFAVGESPFATAVGDFNNDGEVDLVVTNGNDDNVSVLLGNGDGTFASQATFSVVDFPTSVLVNDFDEDGNLDIAVGNQSQVSDGKVSVLLGNGDGTFASQTILDVGVQVTSIAFGDFNEDGNDDIATSNVNSPTLIGNVSIFLGDGNGDFSPQTTFSITSSVIPSSLVVLDADGDGHEDIFVGNQATVTNQSAFILGDGNGGFSSSMSVSLTGTQPRKLALGDFNNDNKKDIVAANFAFDSVSVLTNTSTFIVFNGTDNADNITGNDESNVINGFAGNDTLSGGLRQDTISGFNGADELFGNEGNDRLLGGGGNDTLSGDSGIDRLFGNNGDDILIGGDDRDALLGGNGDDTLTGGLGLDRLSGNGGSDVFVLDSLSSGGDRILIRDYVDGEDKLGLFSDLTFSDLRIRNNNSGNRVTIRDLSNGNSLLAVILDDADILDAADLTESDFVDV